jgi:2-keto-3-deoxy-L-rhamnonate aldolase RhmA
MEIRPNIFREKLKKGLPTIGTRIESPWPHIAEIAASSGTFDYVEFEGEYAPYTEPDLENICRATELYGCSTVNKIDRQNRAFMAQKSIACGCNGLLFADLYTAEEVRETLDYINPSSPNGGIFGRPNRRHGMNGQGRMTVEKYLTMVNDVVKLIMIEKEETMKNLEEICAVPGVDMLVFGPHDYALNTGLEPSRDMAKLEEVHTDMILRGLKCGIPTCVQLNSLSNIQHYLDMGVKHFNLGDEVSALIDFCAGPCKEARDLIVKGYKK